MMDKINRILLDFGESYSDIPDDMDDLSAQKLEIYFEDARERILALFPRVERKVRMCINCRTNNELPDYLAPPIFCVYCGKKIDKVEPKAGEDGLAENPYSERAFPPLSDDKLEEFAFYLIKGGYSPDRYNGCWGRQVWNNAIKAQKALNDKRWIEGIEKIAEIRFELEEHGKIVDKLYQFTDRSWQELKTEGK